MGGWSGSSCALLMTLANLILMTSAQSSARALFMLSVPPMTTLQSITGIGLQPLCNNACSHPICHPCPLCSAAGLAWAHVCVRFSQVLQQWSMGLGLDQSISALIQV